MHKVLAQFRANILRAHDIGQLGSVVSQLTTAAIDVTDIYRAQIVLAVSALDHFIHEMTRAGMVESWISNRERTAHFLRFQIPLSAAERGLSGESPTVWLGDAIRDRHSWVSFQDPDKIADAVRLFSSVSLWESVSHELGSTPADVKLRLRLIVDRRNKIAHEADMDPANPGFRWPIDRALSVEALEFISSVGEAIFKATT